MGIEQFLLDRAEKRGMEEGFRRGVRKERIKFILNLLYGTDFADDRIASLIGVSVGLVAEIRNMNEPTAL